MSLTRSLLDHSAYTDAAGFERERAAVFGRTWLCLGLAVDLVPGTVIDCAGFAFRCGDDGDIRVDGRPAAIERVGGLVLASALQKPDDPTPLLAPYRAWLTAATHALGHADASLRLTVEANWKHLVENTLDDCHVGTLHGASLTGSFADWRQEAAETRHARASDLVLALSDADRAFWDKLVRRLRLRRWGPGGTYRHVFLYPNFYVSTLDDALVMLHRVDPETVGRSSLDCRLVLAATDRASQALRRAVSADLAAKARRVIDEDISILRLAERGRYFAVHPAMLGVRERRIADFQAALLQDLAAA